MSTPAPTTKSAPVWALWANPIFRRYCRSRLRPRGLGISLLITLIIAGFLFVLTRSSAIHRLHMELVDAERLPLIPLLVVQAIILFFLGTGQVAGGITAEADEGVLDYQRLAPMSPMAKVLGYLCGLPVREYVMCLATLPFTLWCVARGEVPWKVAGMLYLAFFASTLLYHLTGLVAGTVVKNRRWAFLISMGAVFFLYTVMPQIAKFGLPYFQYLTIRPVFEESMPYLIPRTAGAGVQSLNALLPQARFFNLDFPEAVFTIATQGVLILSALVMLARRWRRKESHLLSKGWALGLFVWLQTLLLGNALPLVESGDLYPSQALRRFAFRRNRDWQPDGMEAVLLAGIYGLITLGILWLFTFMITADRESQLRGWLRARKLGHTRLRANSDPASSFAWTAAMAVTGAAGWWFFTRAVIESRWFPGQILPAHLPAIYALVLVGGALGFQALLEWHGARVLGLCAILVGVVPLLLSTIVGAIDDRLIGTATWLAAVSPLSAPVFAAGSNLPLVELPLNLTRALPRAFWFWQGITVLVTIRCLVGLYAFRKRIARETRSSWGHPAPTTATETPVFRTPHREPSPQESPANDLTESRKPTGNRSRT